jgi:hypothetical protein
MVAALAIALAGVVAVPGAATAQAGGPTSFDAHLGVAEAGIFVKFWPTATTLTVTVDDPATPQSPDYLTEFVAVETTEAGFGGWCDVEYPIRPGDEVTVTDGTTTKSHTVIDIRVTFVDVDADQVHGTVPTPNSAVHVYVFGSPVKRNFTADASGNWMADFSVSGGPDEPPLDIVPGTGGGAAQFEDDGDGTVDDWYVPRPEGWQHNPVTGHDYLFVEDGMSWADAEAYAASVGGHLVTINDAAENDWLIATFDTDYWIGLNDRAREGQWVWASGEPVTFTDWLAGEPNDLLGEDAAHVVNKPPIGWNDLSDDLAKSFVIEIGPTTLDGMVDGMVADGRLTHGLASSIMKQAEKSPLRALTNHLNDLVRRGVITQLTMDQVLMMVAG